MAKLLTIVVSLCLGNLDLWAAEVAHDDREVYLITSRIRGTLPKIGVLKHASIAICPRGVSPIVYENGVPVSNTRACVIYGTQTGKRGFHREGKRIGVTAMKLQGVSAATIERRIRSHQQLNLPLLSDCRHHVIAVAGLKGRFFNRRLPITLR